MSYFWSGLRPKHLIKMRSHDSSRWRWFFLPWDVVTWVWWVGIVSPVRFNYYCLRLWWARGDIDSMYWSPRVGDRVDACCAQTAGDRVVSVSIRQDEVVTEGGRSSSLRNCVSPHTDED